MMLCCATRLVPWRSLASIRPEGIMDIYSQPSSRSHVMTDIYSGSCGRTSWRCLETALPLTYYGNVYTHTRETGRADCTSYNTIILVAE